MVLLTLNLKVLVESRILVVKLCLFFLFFTRIISNGNSGLKVMFGPFIKLKLYFYGNLMRQFFFILTSVSSRRKNSLKLSKKNEI